jgi:hypothetical protein
MINSFIQMVNESSDQGFGQDGLVDEMGVKRPERLTGSEMGPIRQSSLDRAQQLQGRPRTKTYFELATELAQRFREIKSVDISMFQTSPNERTYYPKFDSQTRELLNKTRQAAPSEDKFITDFGKWRDLFNSSGAIHFNIDSASSHQRSHFPDGGIPIGLRGIGLGYKLYRALLRHVGYISSNRSGTNEKDKAWGSLLDQKLNPDGSVSVDDAHAIIGPANWMAIDKQLQDDAKINVAMSFITNTIGLNRTQPNRFDIDDELLEILPDDFLVKLDPAYLQSLLTDNRLTERRFNEIENSRSEADRRERERQAQAEREAQERRAREEAEVRRRLAARIQQFGADPDEDWNIGDFIVVKSYLFDQNYSRLPIRQVVAQDNDGRYVAVKISDAIAIAQGTLTPGQANDTRTTNQKHEWVKVNIENIPDLTQVNLNPAEQAFIELQMDPEAAERARTQRETADRERRETERRENEERARNRETFGGLPENGSDLKSEQSARNNGSIREASLLKEFRNGYFVDRLEIIVLGPQHREALRSSFGVPVFIPWTGSSRRPLPASLNTIMNDPQSVKLTNAVTGFTIDAPFTGLGLTAYPLSEVTVDDKLRARAGTHYYIAGHKNAFGILAKSDYGTVNTSDQKFIYVKAYGSRERSVSVRLDLLRKIGEPVEL